MFGKLERYCSKAMSAVQTTSTPKEKENARKNVNKFIDYLGTKVGNCAVKFDTTLSDRAVNELFVKYDAALYDRDSSKNAYYTYLNSITPRETEQARDENAHYLNKKMIEGDNVFRKNKRAIENTTSTADKVSLKLNKYSTLVNGLKNAIKTEDTEILTAVKILNEKVNELKNNAHGKGEVLKTETNKRLANK